MISQAKTVRSLRRPGGSFTRAHLRALSSCVACLTIPFRSVVVVVSSGALTASTLVSAAIVAVVCSLPSVVS